MIQNEIENGKGEMREVTNLLDILLFISEFYFLEKKKRIKEERKKRGTKNKMFYLFIIVLRVSM
jgi:hypothetical protein